VTHTTDALLARRAPLHASASTSGSVLLTTVCVAPGADDAELSLSVLDLRAGEEQAIPGARPGDHSAVWAPDGVALAWCSTNAGGESVIRRASRLGDDPVDVPGSVGATSAPTWSPDGASIAFTAPSTAPIDRSRPYRWGRPYIAFDGLGPLDAPPQVRVTHLPTGEARWLTADDWRWSAVRWSPDGSWLAACAGVDPEGVRGGQHLVLLTPEGRQVRPPVPSGRTVVAEWLPNGSLAVLVVDPHDQPVGAVARLFLGRPDAPDEWRSVDVDGLLGGDVYGDHQAELCDVYEHAVLALDAEHLFVRTFQRGRMGVARLHIETGALSTVLDGDRCCTPVAVVGDELLVATVSATHTAELAVVGLDGSNERLITQFAAAPEALPEPGCLPAVEVLRFAVATDAPAPIDAWFLGPAGTVGSLPTVLIVHGGPNFAYGDTFSVDAHALVAAGFGVLYANPRGSTGVGQEFTFAVRGDWADGPTRDLLAVVDEAIARGWVDGDRLGVTGNSYGGYMTAWLAATTTRFRAAVSENPVTDLVSMHGTSDIGPWFFESQFGAPPREAIERYIAQSPLHQAHHCTTPILWVVGEADRRCPNAQAWAMHRAVLRAGTPSEVLVLPASSHEGTTYGPPAARRAHDDALVEWMTRWVGGSRATSASEHGGE